MTTLDLNLYTHMGCWRNIPIYAQASVSVCSQETEDIQALDWCPGFFFFFFFGGGFVSQGQGCCETPTPHPLQSRGAECTHQPMWKPAFSRILPEGVTQRNPLQAPVACWMLCRQLTDTAQGTPVRHLFKCTSDSNLDTSQVEGPNCSSTVWVESHSSALRPGTILQNYALHLALYLAITASRTPDHTKAPEVHTPHNEHQCTPLLGSLPEQTCRVPMIPIA